MDQAPWSQNQLKKLGLAIRDGVEPAADLPQYGEVLLWYNELAAEVQQMLAAHDWTRVLDDRPFEVTSRAKTIDTLRQKLERDHATPLASIQDLAGVRFEAEMSLDDQDAVCQEIARLFDHDPSRCIHDLRETHHSGYRAVHVWLRLAGRVEVQVRTHLQGSWANTYESAADVIGRSIRYEKMPDSPEGVQMVQSLQQISIQSIANLERARNEAARIRSEYHAMLNGSDHFEGEDTVPRHIVDAREASVRLDELHVATTARERDLQHALAAVKSMFDSMTVGRS